MERSKDLARWLALNAPHDSVATLFTAFCEEVVREGAPIHRSSMGLEGLHPEVSGLHHVWTRDGLSISSFDRETTPTSHSYLHSPTRIVDETERPFRRRLDQPSPHLPLLDELRLEGMTDYVMYPLPFLDRTRTAVISLATRQPDGFDDRGLSELEFAVRLLSPYLERRVLRRIARDLLDTYVGPHTGQRIPEGRVDRGAVEQIEAAIWFADLRGFTALSETRPTGEVLAILNDWFGIVGEVITAHGGEILKFMGDAVLAIFPTYVDQDRRTACRRAMAAAEEFTRRTDVDNATRRSHGLAPVTHGPGAGCRRARLRQCRRGTPHGLPGHRPSGQPRQSPVAFGHPSRLTPALLLPYAIPVEAADASSPRRIMLTAGRRPPMSSPYIAFQADPTESPECSI